MSASVKRGAHLVERVQEVPLALLPDAQPRVRAEGEHVEARGAQGQHGPSVRRQAVGTRARHQVPDAHHSILATAHGRRRPRLRRHGRGTKQEQDLIGTPIKRVPNLIRYTENSLQLTFLYFKA